MPVRTNVRKRPYHHDDLRSALVTELLAALEAGQADGLSMRALAGRIGVSHAAAYAHFADKSALWSAVTDVGFDRLGTALRAAIEAADSPAGRLASAGFAYLRFARREPALYRLMFGSATAGEGDSTGRRQAVFDLLEAVVAELPVDGYPRAAERVRADAVAAWSTVHGLASLAGGGKLGSPASRSTTGLEWHVVGTVVRGLQAGS